MKRPTLIRLRIHGLWGHLKEFEVVDPSKDPVVSEVEFIGMDAGWNESRLLLSFPLLCHWRN